MKTTVCTLVRLVRRLLPAAALLLCAPAVAAAAGPEVVATIPPLHGLVAAVMEGVGTPHLLLPSGSPHGYVLRPSDARALASARLVFLIDPRFEAFLARPLRGLPADRVIAASKAPGIRLLPARAGGAWAAEHDHDHEHGHDHGAGADFHLWLDPANARAIAEQARTALAAADPENAPRYIANARRLATRIDALQAALSARLAPVAGVPYIVFHDAYHYFEDAFGLHPAGAVTVSPDRKPGVRRLREIRAAVTGRGARCVFAEPQFPPALVRTILEDTGARAGTLDPLGAGVKPGPDSWFRVMSGLADALHRCLGPAG